jgi:hypothetical protein
LCIADQETIAMLRPVIIAALLALPTAAIAQTDNGGTPPQRVRSVTLGKGQKCPQAVGNEVVVCQTLDEPYRIPRNLRNDGPIPAAGQSWANRAATVDQTSRVAGGLPDTCSPIGTGGQSGCAMLRNQEWAADRRAQNRANESVP